jgi:uncharacterized protein YutE (UPF0331/DUF86 family)
MESQKQVIVFLAEFDYQVELIEDIYKTLKKKRSALEKRPTASESVESAGYWMHNLYSAFEDLFKLVSGFWENSIIDEGDFHVNLLKRMLLSIENVRPPLISQTSYTLLNELRGFRHVFRHAYSYGLNDERVDTLLRQLINQKDSVINDLQKFRSIISGFIKE